MKYVKTLSRAWGIKTRAVAAIVASFGLTISVPSVAEAQLRVSSIDWVQGRPEIPHPAMNGKNTILFAIAEGGNCGGNYSYR